MFVCLLCVSLFKFASVFLRVCTALSRFREIGPGFCGAPRAQSIFSATMMWVTRKSNLSKLEGEASRVAVQAFGCSQACFSVIFQP
eukprot:2500068-Rhodomonas_salina.1